MLESSAHSSQYRYLSTMTKMKTKTYKIYKLPLPKASADTLDNKFTWKRSLLFLVSFLFYNCICQLILSKFSEVNAMNM